MNDVSHPNGDFRSNLYRLRMTYSFSARLHVQGLLQYNEQSDTFSTNLRLSLLGEANTGLFLDFNEIDDKNYYRNGSVVAARCGRLRALRLRAGER